MQSYYGFARPILNKHVKRTRRQCGLRVAWLPWHQITLCLVSRPIPISTSHRRWEKLANLRRNFKNLPQLYDLYVCLRQCNSTGSTSPGHSVHNCFSSCHLISTKLLFNRKKSRSQVLGSVDLEMCVWASEHGFGFSATPLAEILSHDRCTNLFQMGPAQLNGTQLPHIAPGCCQKSCPGAQLDSGGILSPCSFLPVRKKHSGALTPGWIYRFYALYLHKLLKDFSNN